MRLKSLEINGFKSFAKKTSLEFNHNVVCVVGPNGSGKSNVVEAFRFVLGEQSMKSMRGKTGSDLVFKGSKNLPKGTRAAVAIHFDNSDKIFKLVNDAGENVNLNYDTVSLSREVFSDGLNKYEINKSDVRLKDIHNILNSVNIGASSHHIISQGEADRVLNASSRERREMIEDALGLKVYQHKIKEAERKLERSLQNMKEVGLQKRENAPHLNFLRRQVEKFEKAREMKTELILLYKEYFKKEDLYTKNENTKLKTEKSKAEEDIAKIRESISNIEDKNPKDNESINELRNLENKNSEIQRLRDSLERKLGRLEGMIEVSLYKEESVDESADVVINKAAFSVFVKETNTEIDEALNLESLEQIKPALVKVRSILNNFAKNFETQKEEKKDNQIAELRQAKEEAGEELEKLKEEQVQIINQINELKQNVNAQMEVLRDKEREKFALQVKLQEYSSSLSLIRVKEENLANTINALEEEKREGNALVGGEILSYEGFELGEGFVFSKEEQEELKRKIERIKIKLEDAGLGGEGEVRKEYEEVKRRDEFLALELLDLEKSIEILNQLISDLKDKIDTEFKEGIKKINTEFKQFFSLMFGGGDAHLSVVMENKRRRKTEEGDEEEIVLEPGIEIDVSLPHKKVRELQALSGGERSLTSIALLFAMSFVNPPPFLILDETDAALDEANSRKYGDMLERLSKYSQLIVVTHNRETMSRAGILYGVTIGADGASKLLSVKFEEAQAIAK